MGRDRGGARSLKRKVAVRAPRRTFAIFCEGSRTEPEYLELLARHPEVKDVAAVDLRVIEPDEGCVPLTLVQRAIEARHRARSEEGEIDEFWCVFDVEWPQNHPNLRRALDLARGNDIKVAPSNPTFDLWLILHFKEHSGWLNTDPAYQLRRKLDGSKDKGLGRKDYMAAREAAVRRAAALEKMHVRNDTAFPDDNPSSGMHHLLVAISAPPVR